MTTSPKKPMSSGEPRGLIKELNGEKSRNEAEMPLVALGRPRNDLAVTDQRRASHRHRQQPAPQEEAEDQQEEAFLISLENLLQSNVHLLKQSFVVLRAKQINYISTRLHEVLEPKIDSETNLIQAWTIQRTDLNTPTKQQQQRQLLSQRMNTHIQVLKLSTLLREVQCLKMVQRSVLATPIELEIFPSLKAMEAVDTDLHALRNVRFFAGQLETLMVDTTWLKSISSMLMPTQTPVRWQSLKRLEMKRCELEGIDPSIKFLEQIRRIDLSHNCIASIADGVHCDSLLSLVLTHNKLSTIKGINRKAFPKLQHLDVSFNRIRGLEEFRGLPHLQQLILCNNRIEDIGELEHLDSLTTLSTLMLSENPIAKRADYRREVLFFLGTRIELDNRKWTTAELCSMNLRRRLFSDHEVDMMSPGNAAEVEEENDEAPRILWQPVRMDSTLCTQICTRPQGNKLVLQYPRLTRTSLSPFPRHQADIMERFQRLSISPVHSNSTQSKLVGETQQKPCIRTVNDFFQSEEGGGVDEEDIITEEEPTQDEMKAILQEEDNQDSLSEEPHRRQPKSYGAKDFMRDLEEERTRIRLGSAGSLPSYLTDSRRHSACSNNRRSDASSSYPLINVSVLLNGNDAQEYDVTFGIDGLPAELVLKNHEIHERIVLAERSIVIRRPLLKVVAIASSLQATRSRMLLIKSRITPWEMRDVTYKISSALVIEKVMNAVSEHLQLGANASNERLVLYMCNACNALCQVSHEYLQVLERTQDIPQSGSSIFQSVVDNDEIDELEEVTQDEIERVKDVLRVHACLVCRSQNVRLLSHEKFGLRCAAEGVHFTAKANPTSKRSQDEMGHQHGRDASPEESERVRGFHIEENPLDPMSKEFYHSVMVCSSVSGIKEQLLPVHGALD